MDLQFVFGNPRIKKVAKGNKNDKIKRREVSKVKKKAKRKNPYGVKKDPDSGNVIDITKKYMTERQIRGLQARLKNIRSKKQQRLEMAEELQKQIDKLSPRASKARAEMEQALIQVEDWHNQGFITDFIDDDVMEGKKVSKPKKRSASKAKKKAAKKKVVKKSKKKVVKKTKKKAAKRKTTKKKKGKLTGAAKKAFLARMAKGRKKAAKKKTAKKKVAKKKTAKKKVAKKKVAKKKVAKRKVAKRKVAKRKVAKRKVAKRKVAKKKTVKRKSSGKKKTLTVTIGQKGRKSQTIKLKNPKRKKRKKAMKKRRNPGLGDMQSTVQKFIGMDLKEAGSLALGGATYGAVNAGLARFAAPVHNILVKIPVIGSAMPTLVVGGLLNFFGERQNMEILKTLGKGLIGSSVVGMGVNAAQMVPGLKPMAGYDVPQLGYSAPQLGSNADFGGVDYTPDMAGVDYTPDMSGVDYTPDMGYDADFGEYEESDADFGGIPEGMEQSHLG